MVTTKGTILKPSTWGIIRQGQYNRVGHDRGEFARVQTAEQLRRWRSEGRQGKRKARQIWCYYPGL